MSVAIFKQLIMDGSANGALSIATAITEALASAGLAQTADTGQVVIDGVTPVPNGSYQIWGLTDALQATAPFYCKIVFTVDEGYGYSYYAFFSMQWGTATDGAGNLIQGATGSVSAVCTFGGGYGNNSPRTSFPANSYFSGDKNRFCMVLMCGYVVYGNLTASFERTKTKSGVDTNEGLLILTSGVSSTVAAQMLPSVRAPSDQGALAYWPTALNQIIPTMAIGNSIGVGCPICFNLRPYNPGMNMLIYQGTDFPGYSTQQIMMYSAPRRYYIMSPNGPDPTQGPSGRLMMRYE